MGQTGCPKTDPGVSSGSMGVRHVTTIRGHSHQKGIIIPDSFQFLFLDFPDEKSEALERSPRWGLSARRRPDTGRPRSAELLLPPCSPRGWAWLSPRSLCLTLITPARSPRGPRPSAIEGLAQWPSAPRRIRMPAAAAYLGGLPGRPTWVAGAAAVPLAVAVLLAVGVLLRVLQAQLVAHLEGLPHRADDPHRLALRGERLQSAALAPGRGGGEASSRNSAHVGSLASRRAGFQSRKRSGPLGPPASLHSARQPSLARPEQPGPLSCLGAVGPARRPWQVSPASKSEGLGPEEL